MGFLKKGIAIKLFLIVFFSFCSSLAFAITGSITDPGFSSDKEPEKSFFGPVRGSVKSRFSRHSRRSPWENFFSLEHRDSLFDKLFIKTDLSLNYPLANALPSLKSPLLNKSLLFFVLSYRRPFYDTSEVIKWHCFKLYFCFGETSVGLSSPLPEKNRLKSQYSVYVNIPWTSKKTVDQKKIMGLGASLSASYPLFSKQKIQISGISSHFFDTGIYGSRYANEQGTQSNDIFSVFNQAGFRFSFSGRDFIPLVLIYASHLFSLDYQKEWFQGLSLGFSTVWSVGDRLQIVAGLKWGGAIFRHEYTPYAKEAKPFNPDETYVNGGVSWSF